MGGNTNGHVESNEIEFEIELNANDQTRMNGRNTDCDNGSMCPCCEGGHHMDDNIGTHLKEISKLYNLKDSKDWEKFLLLPTQTQDRETEDELDDDDDKSNDDEQTKKIKKQKERKEKKAEPEMF